MSDRTDGEYAVVLCLGASVILVFLVVLAPVVHGWAALLCQMGSFISGLINPPPPFFPFWRRLAFCFKTSLNTDPPPSPAFFFGRIPSCLY